MTGFLKTRGIIVQQDRIREAMRRVNPEGTMMRALRLHVTHRRSYEVPCLLARWHIDGNHKLIRINPFVNYIFSAIDIIGPTPELLILLLVLHLTVNKT